MKVPCGKNCPDRSITCHSTCKKYLDFVKEHKLAKEKKYKDDNVTYALADIKKRLYKQ